LLRATTSAFPDNCRAHGVAGSGAAEPKEPGGNRHAQFQQHSTDQACRGADGAVFSLWMHAPRCACSFSCLDRTLGRTVGDFRSRQGSAFGRLDRTRSEEVEQLKKKGGQAWFGGWSGKQTELTKV
jgi:hypothetical protein